MKKSVITYITKQCRECNIFLGTPVRLHGRVGSKTDECAAGREGRYFQMFDYLCTAMNKKKHSIKVRWRAFAIWQKLGVFPWRKTDTETGKKNNDFYKGAFDHIPFLNKDAKRTFQHLLLRPGYMIRDYIRGDHENYLAPFTALIVFYAFFALLSSVLQPVQEKMDHHLPINFFTEEMAEATADHNGYAVKEFMDILNTGYVYLHLDQFPEYVDTQHESSLAALESTLRSQGIPLFLGKLLILWLAMYLSLRRFKLKMSACAAASAYILCQFSFFMMFAVLLSWGKSTTVSLALIFLLLVWDYRQWLGLSWRKSIRRALVTGIWYGLILVIVLLMVCGLAFLFTYYN